MTISISTSAASGHFIFGWLISVDNHRPSLIVCHQWVLPLSIQSKPCKARSGEDDGVRVFQMVKIRFLWILSSFVYMFRVLMHVLFDGCRQICWNPVTNIGRSVKKKLFYFLSQCSSWSGENRGVLVMFHHFLEAVHCRRRVFAIVDESDSGQRLRSTTYCLTQFSINHIIITKWLSIITELV